MMDDVAAIVSYRFCEGPSVTVAFDRIDFKYPIFVGEQVKVEGRVLNTGRSSIQVLVNVQSFDINTDMSRTVCEGLVTMVHVDSSLKPKGLPFKHAVLAKEKTKDWYKWRDRAMIYSAFSKKKEWADFSFKPSLLPVNERKRIKVASSDTLIFEAAIFRAKNLNLVNTVYGGDILFWMSKVAYYCAKRFTKNSDVVEASMENIAFKTPIFIGEYVTITAQVCYAKHTSFEVEIQISVEDSKREKRRSHTGYMHFVSLDKAGQPQIVPGLDLSDSKTRQLYFSSQQRHAYWDHLQKRLLH